MLHAASGCHAGRNRPLSRSARALVRADKRMVGHPALVAGANAPGGRFLSRLRGLRTPRSDRVARTVRRRSPATGGRTGGYSRPERQFIVTNSKETEAGQGAIRKNWSGYRIPKDLYELNLSAK